MTNTLPWHSVLASDRQVYHDDTRCAEGSSIEGKNRRPGDGGRDPCPRCAGLLIESVIAGSGMRLGA